MKQRIYILCMVLVLLSLPFISAAQDTQPTPILPADSETLSDPSLTPTIEISQLMGDDFVGLDAITEQEPALYGPFDAQYMTVRLPASWQLQPGAELRLNIDTFIGGNSSQAISGTTGLGGVLSIQFNTIQIGEISLDKPGVSSYTIPITDEALISLFPDGHHTLAFLLDAGLHCQDDYQTNVILRHSSLLYLPHAIGELPTSLETLPLPIYQDLPEPESAIIVVPDQPSSTELRSSLITAASFGRLAFNRVKISVIPESQLAEVRDSEHLIFVGRADAFRSLDQVDLDIQPTDGAFKDALIQVDDGVLQYAVSPWNPDKVILVVSGNSDEAVLKSSQALSSGSIIPTTSESLAIVSAVNPLTDTTDIEVSNELSSGLPLKFRLVDLGFETRTAFGIGAHYLEYSFNVPVGSELSSDGEIQLNFAHSSLLNYDVSGMLVRLNDQPLGSVRFSDDTSQRGQVELRIPRDALRGGQNDLLFSADLVPKTPCIDPNLAGVWFSINADTLLDLPLAERSFTAKPYLTLVNYADTLLEERTLNSISFILPDNDPAAWNAAAQFLVPLGNQTPRDLFSFDVLFDHQVPTDDDTLFKERDIVIVGKPADLQSLALFSATLPITFTPQTNQPNLGNSRVSYRIPTELSRGYLQFTRSPFDPNRVVLAILGSSDEGLEWNTQALDQGRLRAQLNGTVAIINGDLISIEDTNLNRDTSTLAQTAVPAGFESSVYRDLPEPERPQWILYAIIGSLGMMGLIILFVAWRAIQAQRHTKRRS